MIVFSMRIVKNMRVRVLRDVMVLSETETVADYIKDGATSAGNVAGGVPVCLTSVIDGIMMTTERWFAPDRHGNEHPRHDRT
jgi:hypothetical protein